MYKLHNNSSLGSWQAHVQGATRLIQCNGPDYYRAFSSPSRILAKYVRGFDIIRAMSNQEETIFGNPEWDHLADALLVRVRAAEFVANRASRWTRCSITTEESQTWWRKLRELARHLLIKCRSFSRR
jgi:hypothetical protein